jgi:hypothetical protein
MEAIRDIQIHPIKMKHLITIFIIFSLFSCAQNQEKVTVTGADSIELTAESDNNLKEVPVESKAGTQTDSGSCDKTALEFVKLNNKNTRADFFHQLDSVRKAQYPNNDHEPAIFVDLTPKLLDKFLKDLNKDQLVKTGNFDKEYYFKIAPLQFSDSKKCKDKISITFYKETCSFILVIHNEFFAEGCQESSVTYGFQINGDKISDFARNEAG